MIVARAAMLSAVCATGCSLTMTKLQSGWQPEERPQCDTSRVPPVLDIAPLIGGLVLLATADCPDYEDNCDDKVGAGLVTILAVPFAVSALVGLGRGSTCRDANKRHAAFLRDSRRLRKVEVPRPIESVQRGRAGGACFGNGTCHDGFHCVPETDRCAPGAVGTEGAICYANDTCDAGLVCDTTTWRCVAEPPPAMPEAESTEP